MEILFFMVMVGMLFVFGYAQQEQGVFRTHGVVALSQEDESVIKGR